MKLEFSKGSYQSCDSCYGSGRNRRDDDECWTCYGTGKAITQEGRELIRFLRDNFDLTPKKKRGE